MKKHLHPARILSLLLALALVFQMTGPALAVTADSFADISADSNPWYLEDVVIACNAGMIVGTSETTFSPHRNLSIAEAFTLAVRMHQYTRQGSVNLPVQPGAKWYEPAKAYAQMNGIIGSEFDGRENETATRAQMAKILYPAMDSGSFTQISYVADNAIPDVKAGDYASAEIYALYRAGILTGDGDSHKYRPSDPIERCEVAAILARMLNPGRRQSFILTPSPEDFWASLFPDIPWDSLIPDSPSGFPWDSLFPEVPSDPGSGTPGEVPVPEGLPPYNAPITEENILAVLDGLDPDGAYIVRQTLNSGSLMSWFKGARNICDTLSTAVHEQCHVLSFTGVNYSQERYYIGGEQSVTVTRTAVFDSAEMDSIIPDSLKSGRYSQYISPSAEANMASRQSGVYGIMNEFTAYCWGTTDTLRTLDYCRQNGNTWQTDDWVAHGEFLYYILTYMLYAKASHPDVYQGIMANTEFLRAFRAVNQTYTDTVAKLHEKQPGGMFGQDRYDSFMEAISTDEYSQMLNLMMQA